MFRITETVKHLLIINVILWIATIVLLNGGIIDLNKYLAFHYPGSPDFGAWQFVTYMFMHASVGPGGGIIIYHLLFNMFGVWMFGSQLEQIWGRNKFIFFYISAGLGSVLLHLAFNYYNLSEGMEILADAGLALDNNTFYLKETGKLSPLLEEAFDQAAGAKYGTMLGASGALYGILVAYAFTFPNAELMMIFLPIPIKAKYFVPLILAGDLFFGFSSVQTGIAHFAHIGGAITGLIMVWMWKKNQFNRNRWN